MASDGRPHQVLREREKEAIKLRLAEDRRDRARELGLLKGQQDAAAAAAASSEAAARAAGAVVSTSASPSSSSAAMGVGGLMAPTMAPPALRRDDSAVAGADPEETAEVRGRTPHVALCLPLDGLLMAS